MMNPYDIVSAVYFGGHALNLKFADGTSRVVDFLPYLKRFNHPDYKIYFDKDEFQKFKLMDGNVSWNEYHMIFTPESLYNGTI